MFLRVLGNVALFLIIVFLLKKRVTMFLTMKEAWCLVEVRNVSYGKSSCGQTGMYGG